MAMAGVAPTERMHSPLGLATSIAQPLSKKYNLSNHQPWGITANTPFQAQWIQRGSEGF